MDIWILDFNVFALEISINGKKTLSIVSYI